MKVLYFVANYHRFAGAQRSLALLLANLDRERVEPIVVLPGEGLCTERLRGLGLDVRVLAAPPELAEFGGGLQRAGVGRRLAVLASGVVPYSLRLARLVRAERVDLVHFNDSRALLMGGLGARFAGVPVVWHVRGDVGILGRSYTLPCGYLADRIILVANGVRRGLPPEVRYKCRVVYNGADPPAEVRDASSRARLLASLDPPMPEGVLIVIVATLIPLKGLHHAIEAVALLRGQDPVAHERARLVIVGDRADEEYVRVLEDRVRSLQCSYVRFAGWSSEPATWIQAADIVVLPTVESEILTVGGVERRVGGGEGMPRSVLEAMSWKKAIVATNVGGVPEAIEDGRSGVIVPPSAPQALAMALGRLVRDPGERERLGAAACARLVERFSVRSMVRGVEEVYAELI